MDPDPHMRQTSKGLEIRIRVQPRAKHCEISGIHNGALKIKVTEPPADNAANRALIKYLSGILGIPKSRFSILSGFKSRDKILHVRDASLEDIKRRLEPMLRESLKRS